MILGRGDMGSPFSFCCSGPYRVMDHSLGPLTWPDTGGGRYCSSISGQPILGQQSLPPELLWIPVKSSPCLSGLAAWDMDYILLSPTEMGCTLPGTPVGGPVALQLPLIGVICFT